MTILADLIGYKISSKSDTVGNYAIVQEWSMAGNDKYSDCAFACLCNELDLKSVIAGQPFVVGEAEAEYFYNLEAGFKAADPNTDKGAVLEQVIWYWATNGWPSDFVEKPSGWCSISAEEIHLTVEYLDAAPAWCQLPLQGNDIIFDDTALKLAPGDGHAVLIVGSDPTGYTIVFYADLGPTRVSKAWWDKFGRGQFAVKITL